MDPVRKIASASRRGGRTSRKALLVAATLAACALAAGAADAANITIITMGTITSGSDASDLFGAGANLAGDPYTLVVEYDALGASYFTDGSFGSDIGDPITGSVTATIDGTAFTSALLTDTSASLIEDLTDVFSGNSGNDAAGDFTDVSQNVSSANSFVPVADLQTDFFYAVQPGDSGLDSYLFTNAADTETVSFTGAPDSVEQLVPEPETWALMATGLLGLGMLARRRRA